MRSSSPLAIALVAAACTSSAPRAANAPPAPPAPSPPAPASSGDDAVPTPKGPLTVQDARRYMLALVNADRRSMKLPPVQLDEEGPAARAGQAHADDMAGHGYLGHYGLDGSVPESRMTAAGGADMVLENASCFTDEAVRELDPSPKIDPAEIAKTESMFFHEVPPNDGHRKNILKPWHTKVAIGIAQPRRTPAEIPVPCIAQEFVDGYGAYAPLPARAHVTDTIRVEGDVGAPAKVAGVGLARVERPKALTPDEANARRTYAVPPPYEMFWTPGFKTRIPLRVKGEHFAIDLPLDDKGRPGLYEVSVWAKVPGTGDFTIVSLRTIRVDALVK